MRLRLNPTVRVSFGLLMLTLSVFFVADWLGLVPREQALELEYRKKFSESLAVQFTSLAQLGDTTHIRTLLTAIVDRDETVDSAAFRSVADDTVIEVGEHAAQWTLSPDGAKSTFNQVIVPIYRGEKRWGSVEVRFRERDRAWYSFISQNSFVQLIAFVGVSGFFLYSWFMRRVLRELDPRQVIPERVKAAFNSLAEGVLILDEHANIVLANTAFTHHASLNADKITGTDVNKLSWSAYKSESVITPDTLPWARVIASANSVTGARLTINKESDLERSYTVNCTPVHDADNEVRGVIVTFDDLTELEKKNEKLNQTLVELKQTQADVTQKNMELQQLATHDPLTNCLNRRAFTEQYTTLFNHAVEHGQDLVCLMADIDHFKRINDNYGHSVGDKVIKFVAEALRKQIRKNDLLGRYGGEEFCIILDGLNLEEAKEVAERIREDISSGDPAMFTSALRVTASFGLASIHDELNNQDELVNKADKALYLSKESGRNKVTLWDEEHSSTALVDEVTTLTDAAVNGGSREPSVIPIASAMIEDAGERIKTLEAIAAERAEQFEHYVAYDQITELPARSLFVDRVEQSLLRAQRDGSIFAVLSFGLSNLNRVNDTLGHEAAQEFLREASVRLQTVLRDTDTISLMSNSKDQATISKLNQGEFGILLPSVEDSESVTWIVKRIFNALQEPLYLSDNHLTINGNVGIGIYPADGADAITLIKHASVSRYYAEQQAGDNKVEYFSEQINRESREQLLLENEMSEAIDNNSFEVLYQPKINLGSGEITGFEALLRWNHPEKGVLTPNKFIEIAERTQLINLIGDWVLKQSCMQINQLSRECGRPLSITVNLSPVQFSQPELVERIMQTLEETGTAPQSLELDLPESCLMDNVESTFQSLSKLQSSGVNISIDDFGTGYSGLSHLRTLPINILKVDRCFIGDIASDAHDEAIVRAIIGMAKALDLTVIAEGVETVKQMEILTALNCDEAQGYLFSRPVSLEKARALLTDFSARKEIG